MEFPKLGQHCFETTCKQLDFLPMKCDACSNIFCRDHIQYSTHSCPESYKKDNQVPVCPLCNKPIPLMKGQLPDEVVGRHIDSDCQSDPAKERRKVYSNKCSHKGCKQKELIPVKCEKCHKNFCLRHRFEDDHNCKDFQDTGRGVSKQGAAAITRLQAKPSTSATQRPSSSGTSKPQQTTLTNIGRDLNRERQVRQVQQSQSQSRQVRQVQQSQSQSRPAQAQSGLTEDEALARAIQMSMAESQKQQPSQTQPQSKSMTQQEEEDFLLAQALAASEEESRRQARRQQEQSNKSSCQVS